MEKNIADPGNTIKNIKYPDPPSKSETLNKLISNGLINRPITNPTVKYYL